MLNERNKIPQTTHTVWFNLVTCPEKGNYRDRKYKLPGWGKSSNDDVNVLELIYNDAYIIW